jgi:hypothetical protein
MAKATVASLEKSVEDLSKQVRCLRAELAIAREEAKAAYASALNVGERAHGRIDAAGKLFVALRNQVRATFK